MCDMGWPGVGVPATLTLHLLMIAAVEYGTNPLSMALLRSEEHTSELQSRQDLPSSPPRRPPDLDGGGPGVGVPATLTLHLLMIAAVEYGTNPLSMALL